MREKDLEKRLKTEVERFGGWAIKFWPKFLVGFPDRIVLLPKGRVVFVELKTQSGRTSPAQKRWAERLRVLDMEYYLIDRADFSFLDGAQPDRES